MATKKDQKATKKSFSPDWLVQGVLSKLGDTFDRLTGRSWNPSSSLATSKLVEKLKALMDLEVRDLGAEGKFVPHNLRLMIQWDKFSTDSEDDLDKLEHELHAAAIDHINDRRYHTYAPLNIEIKTDYFTDGVRLLGSFGEFSETEEDEAAINVTLPNLSKTDLATDGRISVLLNEQELKRHTNTFIAKFTLNGQEKKVTLDFNVTKRIAVGRSKENGFFLNHSSVSKIHASLALNKEQNLVVADTGSTNGTFVDGQRIAYGKAVVVEEGAKVKFGSAEVGFERLGEVLKTVSSMKLNVNNREPATEAFSKSDLPDKPGAPVSSEADKSESPEPETVQELGESANGNDSSEKETNSETPQSFDTSDDLKPEPARREIEPTPNPDLDEKQDWEM